MVCQAAPVEIHGKNGIWPGVTWIIVVTHPLDTVWLQVLSALRYSALSERMSPLRALKSLLLVLVVFLALALVREARAADAPTFVVDLYTIGPAASFPSRFGHSLLCVRKSNKDTPEGGTCYDYGVADEDDVVHVGWTAARGVPSFLPITVPEPKAVAFFKNQGRQVERQRIPLAPDEAARLVAAMDDEILGRRAYAYHPYWANCATKLRDHLDRATNGRLQKGPNFVPKGTFREYLEKGHRGHVEVLTPMAVYVGEGNDRAPTPWEAMFLPAILRDGVADRFNASPEKIQERVENAVETSRAGGRATIVVLAVLVFAVVRLAARRRVELAIKIVAGAFGVLGLSIDLVSALTAWPEVSHNWALLLFVPTDLALPWLPGRYLTLYLKGRLVCAGAVAVLEIVSVAQQPLLPLVLLAALPMAGLLSAVLQTSFSSGSSSTVAPHATTVAPRATGDG
jgi:hypothetical protein